MSDLWPWGDTEFVSEDETRTTARETVMNVPMIVVGFDGSANAQSALQAAVDMAADDGVVHVVTAYRVPSPREMARVMASLPEEFKRSSFDVLDAPRGYLQEAEEFLAERGIDHKGHFIADNPASAILDVADDVGANMIIVGSRGLSWHPVNPGQRVISDREPRQDELHGHPPRQRQRQQR